MTETLEQKIARVLRDKIHVEPYNTDWAIRYQEENAHLLKCLPEGLITRIEHFGSTAVPGLAAKPVVDMLLETSSLQTVSEVVPAILEPQGYDYFWRPTFGNEPPYYAWLIKRKATGERTHHIHIVEADSELWDRLYFRDYLILRPEIASEYQELKYQLAGKFPDDRVEYTNRKGEFIRRITKLAKDYFSGE